MRIVGLTGILILCGCSETPIEAPNCHALAQDQAIIERCYDGDINGQYVGDENCFPFSETREYEGVLITGFEWSEFYPNIDAYEDADREHPIYWFTQRPGAFSKREVDETKCTYDCAFAVRFLGKESICDAYFGHLGGYPKEVIAERDGVITQLDISSTQ